MLAPLTMRQIARLADLSGVPGPTIYKIKLGATENPGIGTLRRFLPHVAAALATEPCSEGANPKGGADQAGCPVAQQAKAGA